MNNRKHHKENLLLTTWNTPRYYELCKQFNLSIATSGWFALLKKYAQAAKSILDIGCGEGTNLYHLARPKALGIGIDISPLAINLARKQYSQFNFKVADAENLPFPNDNFDFTYNITTLEHLCQPEKVIEEMVRVTKKDGFVAFWAPNFGSPFNKPRTANYSLYKKSFIKLIQSFFYLISPPKSLNWSELEPVITTEQDFVEDNDVLVEPYLQTLSCFLRKRDLRIIHEDSGWGITEKEGGKPLVRILAKIANSIKLSSLPPFKYWGVTLFIIAQKPNKI
ncbi:class I SAM-dependent methyltransferase [Patescibacteria group bacterium]|nr:class I SAM-dependent methyltransferase [Patescibacteria group bacterium]MBU1868756.1 class I SAM-dependent methyltransferase [Patescibacteria group bacterium]